MDWSSLVERPLSVFLVEPRIGYPQKRRRAEPQALVVQHLPGVDRLVCKPNQSQPLNIVITIQTALGNTTRRINNVVRFSQARMRSTVSPVVSHQPYG